MRADIVPVGSTVPKVEVAEDVILEVDILLYCDVEALGHKLDRRERIASKCARRLSWCPPTVGRCSFRSDLELRIW